MRLITLWLTLATALHWPFLPMILLHSVHFQHITTWGELPRAAAPMCLGRKCPRAFPSVSMTGTYFPSPFCSLLTFLENSTGKRFLIDTSSQVSVVQATPSDRASCSNSNEAPLFLQVVNSSRIPVYSATSTPLSLASHHFRVSLLCADVQCLIVGADFL